MKRDPKSGRTWENNSRREEELETVDRECSERKVRSSNKGLRKDDSKNGQPHH